MNWVMNRIMKPTTRVRVLAALLLAYGVLCVSFLVWGYAKLLSDIEVTWQVLGDPVEKLQFVTLPIVILGVVVGSAGLLFLKSWARPVLLTAIGVLLVYGLADFVRAPDLATPLIYAIVLVVFLLVARSKPYLQ
jgi:hypothetical protein